MIIYANLNNFSMLTSKLSLDENMYIYDKNKFFNMFIKDMIGKSFASENFSQMFFVLCTELAEWNAILSDYYLKDNNKGKKGDKIVSKNFINFPMARIIMNKQGFDINGPFHIPTEILTKEEIKKLKDKTSIYKECIKNNHHDNIYILFNGRKKIIIDDELEYQRTISTYSDDNNYVCFYGNKKKILFTQTESEYETFFSQIKSQLKNAIDSDLFVLYNGIDLNVNALFPIIQKQICGGLAELNAITPDNKFAFDLINKKDKKMILNKIDKLDVGFDMSFKDKDVNLKLMQNRLFNNCNLFLSQLRIASKFIIGKSLHDLFSDIDLGKKIVGDSENLYTKCFLYYTMEANKVIKEGEFFRNRLFRKYLINHYRLFLYAQDLTEKDDAIFVDVLEKKIDVLKYNVAELLKIISDYKEMLDFDSEEMLNLKVYYFNTREEAESVHNSENIPWFIPCSEQRMTFYKFLCCYQYMFGGYKNLLNLDKKKCKISEPFYMLENNKWGLMVVDKKSKGFFEYIYGKLKNGGGLLSYHSMLLFDLSPVKFHDEQGVVNLYQYSVAKPHTDEEKDVFNMDFDINEDDKLEEDRIIIYILSEYGFKRDLINKIINDPEKLNAAINQIINNPETFSQKSFNKIIDQIKDKHSKNKNIKNVIDLLNKTQDNLMKLRHSKKIEYSMIFKEYLPYSMFFNELYKKINKNLQNTKVSIDKSTLIYAIIKEIKQIVENNIINYTEQHVSDLM